jgi:hypothetical protein
MRIKGCLEDGGSSKGTKNIDCTEVKANEKKFGTTNSTIWRVGT